MREKHASQKCDHIVQAPAPSRPIERGIAGPGLLARVLTSKYAEHTPLYRQSEIYSRQGVELSRSVLSGWVDACCRLLSPLEEALQQYVLKTASCMPTTRQYRCCCRGIKRPRPGVCGRMSVMTAMRVQCNLRQCGSLTVQTEKGSPRRATLLGACAA